MRAVIDTNVLVSALLRPDSLPAAVLSQIASLALEPVVCREVMAEYRAVLPRRHLRLRPHDITEVLALFEAQALWVEVPAYDGHPLLPDPDDWPFLAAARVAAYPLITGNVRHFPAVMSVEVMTAREWVESVTR